MFLNRSLLSSRLWLPCLLLISFGTALHAQTSSFGFSSYLGSSINRQPIVDQPDVPADANPETRKRYFINPNHEFAVGLFFRKQLGRIVQLQFGADYASDQYYSNWLSTPGLPDPVIGGPVIDDPNCPLVTLNRTHKLELPISFFFNIPISKRLAWYAALGAGPGFMLGETNIARMTGESVELRTPPTKYIYSTTTTSTGIAVNLNDQLVLNAGVVGTSRHHWLVTNPNAIGWNTSISYKL